jgi:hypothetical protein
VQAQKLLKKAALVALCCWAAFGCEKWKKKSASDNDTPASPVDLTPIEAGKSQVGILTLKVLLRDDGILLQVGQIPAGSTLECDMDDQPLVPCHDGALFARPKEGDHKISAVALKDGAVTAIGESAPFTILPGTGGINDPDNNPRNPLTVALDNPGFSNGMTVPMTQDFVAKFKYANKPTCQARMQCKYDSRSSPFWNDCDAGGESFTVKKDIMAAGLQYLSVQATCGDQVGPILTLFWYGVPDGYKPMMLNAVQDGQGRHIVNLIKSDDCPESQQRFECAAKADGEWSLCENGNVIDNPAAGASVRLRCSDATGPVLTLVTTP